MQRLKTSIATVIQGRPIGWRSVGSTRIRSTGVWSIWTTSSGARAGGVAPPTGAGGSTSPRRRRSSRPRAARRRRTVLAAGGRSLRSEARRRTSWTTLLSREPLRREVEFRHHVAHQLVTGRPDPRLAATALRSLRDQCGERATALAAAAKQAVDLPFGQAKRLGRGARLPARTGRQRRQGPDHRGAALRLAPHRRRHEAQVWDVLPCHLPTSTSTEVPAADIGSGRQRHRL